MGQRLVEGLPEKVKPTGLKPSAKLLKSELIHGDKKLLFFDLGFIKSLDIDTKLKILYGLLVGVVILLLLLNAAALG